MLGHWASLPFAALAMLIASVVMVEAQTTDAVCLPYFDWMSNSQHQSPCVVASNLLAVCNGGSYNVAMLPDSTHYLGPLTISNADPCQCNTVMYSLMSACGACQGRSYISWSQWSANCPSVSSGFPEPLPIGLHVPGWAYLDPRPSDSFNQIQAQDNTNLTESVVLPPPPSTTSSPRSTSTKKAKASSTTSHHASSTHSHSATATTPASASPSETAPTTSVNDAVDVRQANMVGGVAVGVSVGGLLIVGFLVWWINSHIKRRKQGMEHVSSTEEKPSSDLEQGPATVPQPQIQNQMQERDEPGKAEHLQRYIAATAPVYSPSSSNTGTLPLASVRTNSVPTTPTQANFSGHA